VVAFLRGEAILTVVPRLILGLNGNWGDTSLVLPKGRWHNRLTHEELDGGPILMADLFRRFPVALLVHEQALSEHRITVGGEIKT
jgi:(1->4)-alpha-D-glucan 1-alpha-D-glucosylmutase